MPVMNMKLREAVREGYAKGKTIQEIADECGSSYDNVRTMAFRMKLSWRRSKAALAAREMEWEPKTTPQYDAWLKAKEGAMATLQQLESGRD